MKRVRQRDTHLFPKPVFNWDQKSYAETLRHQAHANELRKKLEKMKELYIEKQMLNQNQDRYKLYQQRYEAEADQLRQNIQNMLARQKEKMDAELEQEQNDLEEQAALEALEAERAYQEAERRRLLAEQKRKEEEERLRELRRKQEEEMRPRTPLKDAGDTILGYKVQKELEKYRKYLENQLPDEINKQVTTMFEIESQHLKDLLKERDKLMKIQIGSFEDYIRMLEADKERELLNMKKLREDMKINKRLNERRVMKIEEAIINTDNQMQDEYELEELAGLDLKPPTYMTNVRIGEFDSNPYGAHRRRRGLDGQRLYSSAVFKGDMGFLRSGDGNGFYRNASALNMKPRSARGVKSHREGSWLQPISSDELRRRYKKDQRVGKILNELDDIMEQLDYPEPVRKEFDRGEDEDRLESVIIDDSDI